MCTVDMIRLSEYESRLKKGGGQPSLHYKGADRFLVTCLLISNIPHLLSPALRYCLTVRGSKWRERLYAPIQRPFSWGSGLALVEVNECNDDDGPVASESDPLIELGLSDDFEFLPD